MQMNFNFMSMFELQATQHQSKWDRNHNLALFVSSLSVAYVQFGSRNNYENVEKVVKNRVE